MSYEFAGDVESVGDGVDGFEIGERVLGGCRFGGYSELVVTRADNVVPLPDDWSCRREGSSPDPSYATRHG